MNRLLWLLLLPALASFRSEAQQDCAPCHNEQIADFSKHKHNSRAGLLGLRLAALAGVGYVMLKIFAVTPVTFLIGLLTAAAAALGEALYQLIYARIS